METERSNSGDPRGVTDQRWKVWENGKVKQNEKSLNKVFTVKLNYI